MGNSVDEFGGTEFKRLEDVQGLVLSGIAGMLVETVYALIENGELVREEGKIVVKSEVKNDK